MCVDSCTCVLASEAIYPFEVDFEVIFVNIRVGGDVFVHCEIIKSVKTPSTSL